MLVKITAVYGGSGVREMGGCTPPILGHLFCNTVCVDFKSAYAHGFARIAACTLPIAIGDPATNAETVLTEARECHDEGVAVALFSELCLTGYSIDDLFLQDTLLEAADRAIGTIVEASTDLRPVLVVGAPLRKGNRVYNCAVVIHRGTVLGVAPKSFLPTYREFYEARWFASGEDQRGETITVAGESVPFGRDLIFRSTDVARARALRRDLRGHVGADPTERLCLAGRCDRAREPLRKPDHHRASRGPPPARPVCELALLRGVRLCRRRSGGVDDRPVLGRADDDLRVRRAARRVRALPRRPPPVGRRCRPRPDPAGAHAAGHLRRQRPCREHLLPGDRVHPGPAVGRHRPAPEGRPVPVRAGRRRSARARLLRGLQHPGLGPGAAPPGDRSAQGRHRGLRWPGLHARADRGRQGDGPAGPAAQRHPRVHPSGVRDR